MKFFLDSADVNAISRWNSTGLIDGLTTNPSLLVRACKEGKSPKSLISEICQLMGDRPVSVEVTEKDPQKVFDQALKISQISKNVVVKIPCCSGYVPVMRDLIAGGVKINVTLVFSVSQAIQMAKLGVGYISIFIGRLEDVGVDGISLLQETMEVFSSYNFSSKVITASVRSVEHIKGAALCGSNVATVPLGIFERLLDHPLSILGMEQFILDWNKSGLSLDL